MAKRMRPPWAAYWIGLKFSAARARLAGAEIPRWIEIADALPLNTNGKVDRGQIRERLTRGYLPAAPQPWGKADSVREEKEVREE